ncbi:MAG TPA: sulfide/dihydroorotate dehydrogenase-like FAD/NAD-binding protein [Desulfobacteraceae bacterium]|nr:MAG: ferredoxin-NADP reductase [Desulfobacteraceae bacterium 4484_190.3]RLB15651.1 MAG: sulfide/dihydroorotate dehydrogenase-like FAD/NAD-binding protein [Deltaproteobacteria bacterium]HDZ23287.1 sulfide/dihydroorotate dehydrogenase-like FAD/NAD-binding protein [Desulfobacteraceae bacterium]
MNEVLLKETLSPQIIRLRIDAPIIARKRKPGQFVILRVHEKGERIPLTIVDSDPDIGTITLIFQVVGKTTHMLSELKEGDNILDLVGPLGKPTAIECFGTVVVVGGGIGAAVAYPIAKGMKYAGNKVITILGARNKNLLVLEGELASVSDEIIVTTDDGSYKRHGMVTEPLKELLEKGKINEVLAIGPVPMMRAVSEMTKPYNVRTQVSLNPIMVDGTGMCGACRVNIAGRIKFACIDGPEFDGHQVDFRDLQMRLTAYREEEKQSYEQYVTWINRK